MDHTLFMDFMNCSNTLFMDFLKISLDAVHGFHEVYFEQINGDKPIDFMGARFDTTQVPPASISFTTGRCSSCEELGIYPLAGAHRRSQLMW